MKRYFLNSRIGPEGLQAPLATQGDVIAQIGTGEIAGDGEVIDCAQIVRGGGWLMPAIIDLGVFAVDRRACHAGGIARVGLMPDQSPVLDDPGIVRRAALMGKPELWVHPLAAATQGLKGDDLAEMAINQAAGARAVATGRGWIADSGVMRKVLAYARDCGLAVIAHAEDGGLAAGAVATEGETAMRLGLPSAPAAAEALAIARDLILVEETGARLHFRQVTTAQGLELVRRAKDRGLPVTCGITPAHLLLSDIDVSDFRTYARLSPPLRSDADRRACLAALADGTIDVLFSGHDPRGPEEKRLPFADAEPGMSGAETLFALGMGFVHDGTIGLARLFELLAENPARILGLDAGRIAPGLAADLILVDPGKPWRIDAEAMVARAGNTPFDGLPVQGKVAAIWKGGKRVG
ncbi:dihydroorotase family protein [Sphingomonas canadensis]|uniref:Dihydroorotase family protein n=1 Tax=Sphingomonas canadensis TaxID=1219257 RepID=A0ABW3H3Y8_9SPHN|nr:dihydroorotase [Sphingomonas canadensis]MCW3835504.1 dihydroorotase [Sphingomonas canadensis]